MPTDLGDERAPRRAPRRLVTSGELARELGVSAGAVRSWVRDGLITPAVVTPGGHRRYDVDQVRAELKALRERAEKDDEGEAP